MKTRPFPRDGMVRLSEMLAPNGPLPISRSTAYAWIAQGILPRPMKPTSQIALWKAADIWAFVERQNDRS